MDICAEDPQGQHSRVESDPHFFRDAQMVMLDDETGNLGQMASARRDARVVCESFSTCRNFYSVAKRVDSDPHFYRDAQMVMLDDETGNLGQMGSARRDARVVCESFSTSRKFSSAANPKSRQAESRKCCKTNSTQRNVPYSRNPLLACFLGESVLSTRTIQLSPSCDPCCQRTFFSLIPVDKSRVNENTGEPQSPQLSCLGQVKHRHVKVAKTSETVTEDLARMDINDDVVPHSTRTSKARPGAGILKEAAFTLQKEEFFKVQKESLRQHKEESIKVQLDASLSLHKVETFKLRKEESFKIQKEESFRRLKEQSLKLHRELSFDLQRNEQPPDIAFGAIPHLDLADDNLSRVDLPHLDPCSGQKVARLMRSRRVVDDDHKIEEDVKVSSPSRKPSLCHLNHFLKQKLGASMIKSGFVCGWSSGETSPRSPTSPRSERSEPEYEHCEIDLSRFASGDLHPIIPSFRDSRTSLRNMGKKLAGILVHAQELKGTDRRSWTEDTQGKEEMEVSINAIPEKTIDSSAIVSTCSPATVILRPAAEASLWKRRCIFIPRSQGVCT